MSDTPKKIARKPYLVRFPQDLKLQLESVAQESERSLHGEIINRLRQSLNAQKPAA